MTVPSPHRSPPGRFFLWDVDGGRRDSWWRRLTPPQLFVGSFLALVLGGTVGLQVLPGLYTGPGLSWVDALFTAVSAACVTGLVVVDTATYFTPLGQAYLLLLIQLGGLGVIAFTSVIIVALGRRLSLRQEALASTGEIAPHVDFRSLVRGVFRFTFALEAAGALALWLLWGPRMGWAEAAWPAVFHAVSAFCNAGFSTFSDSLIGFQQAPGTLLVVMGLIVAGGLGFLTLEELWLLRQGERTGRRFRLSVHSRLVLAMTALLTAGGWALFTAFEWGGTLAHLPAADRVVNGLFLSVTPRTAGFNSIDYTRAADNTNLLTILLMGVGGSPGSTAGGIKTTTVALIGLLAWSRLRGREVTSVAGRSIPEETIQRAVGLFVVAFGVLCVAAMAMVTLEPAPEAGGRGFLAYVFEAASAFNTVGLSMNTTAELSAGSQLIATALMFLGRVGMLTFAAAIALRDPTPAREFRFAYEDVVVG